MLVVGFCVVVPTGIEPVSNAPEAFVVSILLRDR